MIIAAHRTTIRLVAAMFLVIALGLGSYLTHGLTVLRPDLAGASTVQLAWNYQTSAECLAKVKTKPMFCIQLGDTQHTTLGILGDSTANSLVPGLADSARAHEHGVIHIGQGSCPPIRGMLPTSNNPDCPAIVEESYRIILEDKTIKTVILAFFTNDIGGLKFTGLAADAPLETRMKKLMTMLDNDIAALKRAGKKVIITYDTPLSPIDAKDCINRPITRWLGTSKQCTVNESEIVNRHPQIDMLDAHFLGRPDVCIFHQSPALFTNGSLNFRDATGQLMIRDRHHLSVYGSQKMAQLLEQSPCKKMLTTP